MAAMGVLSQSELGSKVPVFIVFPRWTVLSEFWAYRISEIKMDGFLPWDLLTSSSSVVLFVASIGRNNAIVNNIDKKVKSQELLRFNDHSL